MVPNSQASSSNELAKCAHSACSCVAAPSSRYCSPSCEKQARSGSASHTDCDCGHATCARQH